MKKLNKFTKIIAIIMAILVLAATAMLAACSAYVGDPASDFKYEIWDGEVTITGYVGKLNNENIKIPKNIEGKSVTSIGGQAFSGCTSLTSINVDANNTAYKSVDGVLFTKDEKTLVQYPAGKTAASYTIPSSVTSIGRSAFYNCTSLTSITIPFVGATKGGTSNTHFGYIFGASSYSGQASSIPSSLKTVIITGGSSIGSSAFYGCTSLASITIPSSVTSIGSDAFYGCSSLTILCRATSKPSGWNTYWNYSNRPVVWGYTGA